MAEPPICPYCGKPSVRKTGLELHPHRIDLAYKVFYKCAPCGAWIGCHDGTETPLGRLANKQLRLAKWAAHRAFDPIWQRKVATENISKTKARMAAYRWLSETLGLEKRKCHIGMADVETCIRIVEACSAVDLAIGAQLP